MIVHLSLLFPTWQEESLVARSLNEGVGGVPVSLHLGKPHFTAIVGILPHVPDHLDAALLALDHDPVQVLHVEAHVLDPVPVVHHVLTHGQALRGPGLVRRLEHKQGVLLLDHVGRKLS